MMNWLLDKKMGINVANADLKKFDLIKELETARANLKEKNSDIKKIS